MQMPRRLSSDSEKAKPIFHPSVVGRSATLQTDSVIAVKFFAPSTNGDRRNGLSNVLSMSIAVMRISPCFHELRPYRRGCAAWPCKAFAAWYPAQHRAWHRNEHSCEGW